MVTNREFYRLFIRYITTVNDKDDEPATADKNAVLTHAKERSYVSIDGTKVNSKAEKEIMDFLLTHKINGDTIRVRYETDVGGFKPDFYLSQYELFIEHWGINKDGEVPAWFSQSSQEYRDLMETKKRWFAENDQLAKAKRLTDVAADDRADHAEHDVEKHARSGPVDDPARDIAGDQAHDDGINKMHAPASPSGFPHGRLQPPPQTRAARIAAT